MLSIYHMFDIFIFLAGAVIGVHVGRTIEITHETREQIRRMCENKRKI